MNRCNRRDFIKSASILPFAAAAIAGLANPLSVFAQLSIKPAGGAPLKTSLNAYSFNMMLSNQINHLSSGVTLLQVLDFAAKSGFEGFDATCYYFPGYPQRAKDSYVKELKQRAADLGLGISGTGVRNSFTTSDKTVRAAGIELVKTWVEVSALLGAPVMRVFADTQNNLTWHDVAKGYTRDQVQDWMVADISHCAQHGKQYGVCIGVQNHGDFIQTGDQLMSLVNAVGSEWCRPIVDTGHFATKDPYADIAVVAPHAVNWQIKQSPFGEQSDIPTDL